MIHKQRLSCDSSHHVDVVFIDIGGNHALGDVLRMIHWAKQTLKPNFMVVKSEEMIHHLQKQPKLIIDNEVNIERDGIISNGSIWFQFLLQQQQQQRRKSNHSNKKMKSITMDPKEEEDDETTTKQALSKQSKHDNEPQHHPPPPQYNHPLKAPMALSPRDNKTPICRYHNYH